MREEFEKMVAAGKLEGQHVDQLIDLTTSGYCMHRSWGFGKITTVDTVFARFTIDFQGKPGHSMNLDFAAENLKPIPKDHILARKASDLEGLRQKAALNHLELIKLVLQSYGGKATVDQIQQVLVPDVIADDWKKWWDAAKKELKKDGHFVVPLKKSEPIEYEEQEISLQDRLLDEFRSGKGLKAHVNVATEILKNLEDLSDAKAAATEVIEALNAEIVTHQRTKPVLALEATFVRDDLSQAVQLPAREGEITTANIWAQDVKLGEILEEMPAAKHKRALETFKEANPDNWHEVVEGSMNFVSARICKECANLLISEGKFDSLKENLAKMISHHTANSELLLWLAKERSDEYADILGPEVFRAMLTAMERDQFNERRSNRLRDYILDDQKLLVELIGSADLDVIRDLTRTLQLSPCFDDMDKRSLLARIVKSYPAVQSLISGEQTKQDASLIVSWRSLERRKDEYQELVKEKIPANSKEIAIARGYGDLRENHEYKAAKEMQKILMRRKTELESQLVRARGTDFSDAGSGEVGIGTVVDTTEVQSNQKETFTILGAWDSDPGKGIISYLSPVAQALMGHKVGEEAEFEVHGTKGHYRIEAIRACPPQKQPGQEAREESSSTSAPTANSAESSSEHSDVTQGSQSGM